jgi:hypothetical protein
MHRRALSLLVTPTILAAMTVAVPALAGTDSAASHRSTARTASSSGHCFNAVVGGRRVRECEISGPRGPRGFLGPSGPRGIQGKTGRVGATGPAGAPGTARAYALVQPESAGTALVAGQSAGFTSVSRIATGIYCLAPVSTINAASEPPVASGEVGYSASETFVPLAVVDARQPNSCAANEFEVKTYKVGEKGPTVSGEVAFTIIVP